MAESESELEVSSVQGPCSCLLIPVNFRGILAISLYLRPGKTSWIRLLRFRHQSRVILPLAQQVQVALIHRWSQLLISRRPEQQGVPQPCWAVLKCICASWAQRPFVSKCLFCQVFMDKSEG
jgi:hypothetical protein